MIHKKIFIALLSVIFLSALFLRLYRIDTVPLYSDETSGHLWFYHSLSSLGVYPLFRVIQIIYLKTFSLVWLFGNNSFGVRFPAAFFGSLLPFTIYLFAHTITNAKGEKAGVALLSAVLMITIPWGVMTSRIGYTNIPIVLNLILIHLCFFIRAKNIKDYLLSLFFLFIALFYYQSMVIIAPLIIMFTAMQIYPQISVKHRRNAILLLLVCGLLLAPLVNRRYNLLSKSARGLDLAIWNDINTPFDVDKDRALSWKSTPSLFTFFLPPEKLANKLFLNRAAANLNIFVKNYLSFFSPDWLFLKGDAILRHSTGRVGAFFPFLLPFMLYGAFRFFKSAEPKTRNLFLLWIFISPIPAAITKDGAGYLLRAVTMLPFLTYFCALGLVDSFSLIHKRLKPPYFILLTLIFVYSAWSFFYGYFHVYPALSARAYEFGFKELSDFQVKAGGAPMLVLWDGYYHNGDFRFWQKTPFEQYEGFKFRQLVYGETTVWQTFPNLYFTKPNSVIEIQKFIEENPVEYVVLPDRYFLKYPEEIKKILSTEPVEEITYPDKTAAFGIYTLK